MEMALEVRKGKEKLVSARDVQNEFHGRTPWGVSFICPFCHQPLFPAAMALDGAKSPHFKHQRNNERAHECDYFASRYGYFTTYQRVPMPMFIKKSRSQSGWFIVEGGFRKLDPSSFARLVNEGAAVVISQKRYKVTPQRFNSGLTRLPFEEISLSCGSSIRLENSTLGLNATWGSPEDATRAMVFTRDADSEQGKRLKKGDTLVFETDLYLLAPERELNAIERAFPGLRRVGYAGSLTTRARLSVYAVTLSKENASWRSSKQYLEECGFEVADNGDTPELLWPPSLKSGGDLMPLFSKSRCVFEASFRSSIEGKLFVHTNADTVNRVQAVLLRKAGEMGCGFAILKNTASLSFVTTRNWVFSSAVLLHPRDFVLDEWLHAVHLPRFEHSLCDDGCLKLLLNAPGLVVLLRRGASSEKVKAVEDACEFSVGAKDADVVRVFLPLGASLDDRFVYEHEFEQLTGGDGAAVVGSGRMTMSEAFLPDDVLRAIKRNARRKVQQGEGLTERIAIARRHLR